MTFTVTLSTPANATISSATGTGTIVNDDVCGADVGISMTTAGGPTHFAGQTLTYNITVTNAGPTDAASVVVTDVLPAGASFVWATASQGSCSGTTTVSCTLGTIANGGNATITLQVTPSAAGTLSNTAAAGRRSSSR